MPFKAGSGTQAHHRGPRVGKADPIWQAPDQMAQMPILQEQVYRETVVSAQLSGEKQEGEGEYVDHAGAAPVMSSQSYELPRSPTQSLAPVLPQRAERPLGRGDCMRYRLPGRCLKCGGTVPETHLVLRLISGAFCERCCPACHPGA